MRRFLQPAGWLAILTVGLGLVLAACSSATSSGPTPDTTPPSLSITSSSTSSGVTYHLKGKATDNKAATKLTYSVNGGATKTVDLSGTAFDVSITLKPGVNTIDVTVFDAAGNKASKTIQVTYAPGDSLTVTVNAPSGVSVDVSVTGPNGYSHAVNATTTLTGLKDGSYSVKAASVTSAGTTYTPTPASQTVSLSGGQTGQATVAYASGTVGTGGLTINVSGLPTGTHGDVTVTGPNGIQQTVTNTQTLTGLAAGSYTIKPNAVTINSVYWEGTATPSSVDVAAGATGSSDVVYQAHYGSLKVDISGVPSGHTASVSVAGPNSYQQNVSATTTLNNLDPGSYAVTAPAITDQASGDVYAATVTGSPVDVQADATRTAYVTYTRSTNHLSIDVSGLPAGVGPDITVTGPSTFSKHVTSSGTTTYTGLADGTYSMTAAKVTSASTTYVPNPLAISIPLGGGQDQSASFVYSQQTASTGSLTVNISGLLNGTAANVSISGPGGYAKTVTATTTLGNLTAGTYTLTVNKVSGSVYDYSGTAVPASVDVPAGGSGSSNVTYHATNGALTIDVSNLPTGTAAGATLTTPSGAKIPVDASTQLDHLPAGTYTFTVNRITGSDGELYDDPADHGAKVQVNNGQTASKTLAYQQVSGDLSVTILGLATGSVDVNASGQPSRHVTQTTTLKGLYAGPSGTSYGITVNNVKGTNFDWKGQADHPSVLVQAGQLSAVTVTYNATDGALQFNVSGLPSGVVASFDVKAPNGSTVYSGTSNTVSVPYLAAGIYTVDAHPVDSPDYGYGLGGESTDPYTLTFTVKNGQVNASVVYYYPFTGILDVQVASPTNGTITPAVTITARTGGLISYLKTLTNLGTTDLKFLDPNGYTITASGTATASYHYTPTVTPSTGLAIVKAGQPTTASVDYEPSDGALKLTFSGPHPTGTSYDATVTTPSGSTYTVTTSTANAPILKSYQAHGAYTIVPDPYKVTCKPGVTVTLYKYTMTPSSPSVTNGQTEAVSIVYSTSKFTCPSPVLP